MTPLAAVLALAVTIASDRPVVVGSKNFVESTVLAERMAEALERAGIPVVRKFDLGGTLLCFDALRTGAIDVYPEYSGTALVAILGEDPPRDPVLALARARRLLRERHHLAWLEPFGFENGYAIAVRRDLAERLHLKTLSDLARAKPSLRLGASEEFVRRADGLARLRAYGLSFEDVRAMSHDLALRALAAGEVDAIDAYATDPELSRGDLVALEDDRRVFPAYHAAPLAREDLFRRWPRAREVLDDLGGTLDQDAMRGLNARAFTDEPRESRSATILARTAEHLALAGAAVLLSCALAIPAGLLLARRPRASELVLAGLGVVETIPSLALLGLLVPLVGIGPTPALVALVLYGLLPVTSGTVVGLRGVDASVREASLAAGLGRAQLLRWVELPLALPSILAGVRTCAVLAIGTATLAAFIGGGGLGEPIFAGIKLGRASLVLEGAVPAALLAVLVDAALAALGRRSAP